MEAKAGMEAQARRRPSMTAAAIAEALHGRKSGDRWFARCPSHDERTPSLSIRDVGGVILLRCFGGCSQASIIRALRSQGLWPERPALTPADRRAWARARAEAAECLQWFSILASDLEEDKLSASNADDMDRLAPAAAELYRLRSLTPAGLIQEFRRRQIHEPRRTALMVARGRAMDAACSAVAGMVLEYWRIDAIV
jgi:hypothetical protein